MSLSIHGTQLSQPTRSVIEFCKFCRIDFNFIYVNIPKGEQLSVEFQKLNPFGLVPVILHEGFNLWESPAIITYLADAYDTDTQWYPKDRKIRARIDAYLHWHHENVREPIAGYVRGKVIGPLFFGFSELSEDDEVKLREKMHNSLRQISEIIRENRFIARTEQLTIADIFAFNEIFNTQIVNLDLSGYPDIVRWYNDIASIPEVVETSDGVIERFFKLKEAMKSSN
ncbi:hypothetical protein SteCoe_1380 [Stentor coeruleus]|uniref:Glutathione transferase n=1 Tax=Stentor coeruleus TaxID=5963 RepID=A0A1R2D290_9CILI|nr:hypothetical protein SteCoe_1380 [Stentor coeruleus]